MDQKFNCPGCGGVITLVSSATVFVVCSYCRSTLIHDRDWSAHGKIADLPAEVTYLQLGTKGRYKDQSFELVGRRRVAWRDGFWTEWCASFSGRKYGWLIDAQGSFAFAREWDEPLPSLRAKDISRGTVIRLNNQDFSVDDKKDAVVVGTEGEMPYVVKLNQEITTVDASNSKGEFCSIEFDRSSHEISAFVGEYLDFRAFHFENLRQLDDW